MTNSQRDGIRLLGILLGWAVGYALFGANQTWLFGMPSFIWCGIAGLGVASLIAGDGW